MKLRALILLSSAAAIPFARGGAAYVVAESFTPGYEALDMTVDLSVEDSFSTANYDRLQQDSASFTGSWYFSPTRRGVHQIDLGTGVNLASIEIRTPGIYFGYVEYAVPLYSRYNYNFRLFHNSFLYVGGFAGGEATSRSVDIRSGGNGLRDSTAAIAGLCGVGAGLRHFGRKWGFELAYDYRLRGVSEGELDFVGKLSTAIDYRMEHVVNFRMILRF